MSLGTDSEYNSVLHLFSRNSFLAERYRKKTLPHGMYSLRSRFRPSSNTKNGWLFTTFTRPPFTVWIFSWVSSDRIHVRGGMLDIVTSPGFCFVTSTRRPYLDTLSVPERVVLRRHTHSHRPPERYYSQLTGS